MDRQDAERVGRSREELLERMARVLPEDGIVQPFDGFYLARTSQHMESANALYQPAFCFVVQGSKQALLGEEVFRYDPGHYLIYTVDLPIVFRVEEASEERPYYGLLLSLDPALVASVLIDSGFAPRRDDADAKAIGVNPVDANLLDAVVRLTRLLDEPGGRHVLAPLITKEIVYRLLAGGEGARLGHLLASSSGDPRRIAKAIGHLQEHYDKPLSIESVARELGMSVSGFHHQFKSVTAMSPLQFQKQIRLQAARRLMLGDGLDAARAGARVGYEDSAYFSRDYKKLFGASPKHDIARLRSNLAG
jgi:AraC-like DNA-binding protein